MLISKFKIKQNIRVKKNVDRTQSHNNKDHWIPWQNLEVLVSFKRQNETQD